MFTQLRIINLKFNRMEKYHGNTVEYWKQNAEENYLTTPISVLKYITVLEEQAEQLRKHAVMRMMAVSFAKWLRDNTVADGAPKLLLRLDMKRYTIEELYDLYTLITE